jgi:O-antigen/teichoic acid export membrane protein
VIKVKILSSISSRLIRGTKYSFLSLVIVSLVATIQSIIVARLLGPRDLGIFTILNNLQSIVVLLATFGIPAATVKFVAEFNVTNRKMLKRVISTSFFLISFIAILISILYFLSAQFIALQIYHEQILITLIMISSVNVVISSIFSPLQAILQGLHKIELLSKLNILNSFISLPIIVFFVFKYGLIGVVVGALIYVVIRTVINFRFVYKVLKEKKVEFQSNIDKKIVKKMLNYGFPALLSGIVVVPVFWFANTILALKSGFGQVGLFGVARTLSNLLIFIPSAIAVPLVPLISELYATDPREMSNLVSRIFRLVGLFLLPFVLILGLYSRNIILIVYGQQFYDAWYVLYFMATTAFLISLSSIVGYAMLGTGKMWDALGVNLFWMIIFISVSYYLIPDYGLNGLGYTYLISYLLFTALIMLYGVKKLKIKFENLSPLIILSISSFIVGFFILINLKGLVFYFTSFVFLIGLICLEYVMLAKEDRKLICRNIRGLL